MISNNTKDQIIPGVKILRKSVFCKFVLTHGLNACHYEVLEGKAINGGNLKTIKDGEGDQEINKQN